MYLPKIAGVIGVPKKSEPKQSKPVTAKPVKIPDDPYEPPDPFTYKPLDFSPGSGGGYDPALAALLAQGGNSNSDDEGVIELPGGAVVATVAGLLIAGALYYHRKRIAALFHKIR